MEIVADECVDVEIVERLRNDGHEVLYIAESSPGMVDEDVLRRVSDDSTLLLTADKDFGELAFRQGLIKRGILLYRLPELSKQERADLISATITQYREELLPAFSVLTEKAIRVRRI